MAPLQGLFAAASAELVEGDRVFDAHAEADDGGRAAVAVVAGVGDVLIVERHGDAAPDVGGVVSFENLFQAVAQAAVAEDESFASELEIAAVVAGNTVGTAAPTLSSGRCQRLPRKSLPNSAVRSTSV